MIIVMKQNAPLTEIERLEDELREKGFQVDRSCGSSKDLSEIRRASMSAIS